jgi:hypothetical protein
MTDDQHRDNLPPDPSGLFTGGLEAEEAGSNPDHPLGATGAPTEAVNPCHDASAPPPPQDQLSEDELFAAYMRRHFPNSVE